MSQDDATGTILAPTADDVLPDRSAEPGCDWRNGPLAWFVDHGIGLSPANPKHDARTGKIDHVPEFPWTKAPDKAFTTDPAVLDGWWQGLGWHLYFFLPPDAGFLVLDLDRHAGENGVLTLPLALVSHRVVLPFSILRPPVWVETPSRGAHIYFRYRGPEFPHFNVYDGVEVIHARHILFAPGSRKVPRHGGPPLPYLLHGNLDAVPDLPLALEDFLWRRHEARGAKEKTGQGVRPRARVNNRGAQTAGKTTRPSFAQIETYLQKHRGLEFAPGQHNDFCIHFSSFAANKGYERDEVLSHLAGYATADYDEAKIAERVDYIFNNQRRQTPSQQPEDEE